MLSFAAVETVVNRLAKFSADLSDGNAVGAMSSFDKSMKGYGDLAANIDALTAQTEISCIIDIIEESDADGVHKMDTDWVVVLKSKGEHGPTEHRRERIQLELKMVKGKWRITSMSELRIFAPLRIP